jgi:hypothetical protein
MYRQRDYQHTTFLSFPLTRSLNTVLYIQLYFTKSVHFPMAIIYPKQRILLYLSFEKESQRVVLTNCRQNSRIKAVVLTV